MFGDELADLSDDGDGEAKEENEEAQEVKQTL